MSNPTIDWSDLENVEPVPGGEWDGRKIVGHFQVASDTYSHLVISQNDTGVCDYETLSDDGCLCIGGTPLIRNKPRRVTLQECWVIYFRSGHMRALACEAEVDRYRCAGYIVRHIPAEEREV